MNSIKSALVILSVIFSATAHAEYKVGDTATYASVFEGQPLDIKYEVAAVDAANDLVKITETLIVGGAVVQTTTEDASIAETAQNEQIYDACLQMPAEFQPRYETFNALAGKFNVCHLTITDESGAVTNGYFAKVIFGVVKLTKEGSTDGSDMSMELKSFKKL